MMGARETPPPGNGATADAGAPSASPFAWADGFMDLVAKYERNSERQLYVYGINVSRCASCRHRLKSDAKECENCHHAVPTKSQACMRCREPKPGLWCYECDAYFCGPCHSAPHVLVLNGSAPEKHNCFPIDGSSGKLIRHGAWSSSLLALAKTARRSQMKLREDEAIAKQANSTAEDVALAARMESLRADEKTRSVEKERKQAAKETARRAGSSRPPPAPASSSRQPSVPPTVNHGQPVNSAPAQSTVRSRSPSPVPPTARPVPHPKAKASPSTSPTKQSSATPAPVRPSIVDEAISTAPTSSRKRKVPTTEAPDGSDQTATSTASPAPQPPTSALNSATADSAPTTPAAPTVGAFDGMSLHAKLLQMKNKKFQRSHSGTASQGTTPQTDRTGIQTPPNPVPPPTAPVAAPQVTSAHPPLPSAPDQVQRSQPASVSVPALAAASVSSTPTAQSPSIKQDPMLEEVMSRPIESPPAPLLGVPAGAQAASNTGHSTEYGASVAGSGLLFVSDNALVDGVVAEFERQNAYAAGIEGKLLLLSEAVKKATSQDIRMASAINTRAEEYRNALRVAYENRDRALANVIIFSPEIREFARGLTAGKLQDLPAVVSSCCKKCTEIAQKIREAEARLQQQRDAIDLAVSSGDTEQLQALGNSMKAIDDEIRGYKKDRDGQFNLMLQFSQRLRDIVRSAYAAMGTKQESRRAP